MIVPGRYNIKQTRNSLCVFREKGIFINPFNF